MKKINLIISFIMAFVLYFSLLLWGKFGIIRDEYGITGNGISFGHNEMILLIIFPLFIIIINLMVLFQKKAVKKAVNYSIIVISIFVLTISTLHLLKINGHLNKITSQVNQMQKLTMSTFMEFLEKDKTGFVYVKRDDCTQCIELNEYINDIIADTDIIIYYYSTSQDRDKNPDEMYKLLESINVVSVPVLLKIENGNITNSFTFEDKEQIANLIKSEIATRGKIKK